MVRLLSTHFLAVRRFSVCTLPVLCHFFVSSASVLRDPLNRSLSVISCLSPCFLQVHAAKFCYI